MESALRTGCFQTDRDHSLPAVSTGHVEHMALPLAISHGFDEVRFFLSQVLSLTGIVESLVSCSRCLRPMFLLGVLRSGAIDFAPPKRGSRSNLQAKFILLILNLEIIFLTLGERMTLLPVANVRAER